MPAAPAIAAVGALASTAGTVASMASGGGAGGGQSSSSTSSTQPWGPQQPYLNYGLGQAQNIYQDRQNNPLPSGPWTAPENDWQSNALSGLYNGAINAGQNFGGWANAGNILSGNAGNYSSNANNIATNGIGARDPSFGNFIGNYALTGSMPGASSVNGNLVNGVTGAAQQGLGSIAQGQSLANQVGATALDPNAGMNATVNGATQFANNAGLDAQIDAANRDVTRELGEDTLRGIRQGAMTSGGANSSREAAQEAIATRGASDRMADTAAQIRGAAYNEGGQLASNQFTSGLNTALGASSALNTNGGLAGNLATSELNREQNQGQFDTTSRLGAAQGADASNLGWQTANTAAQLGGNAQLGTGLTTGMNASNTWLNGILNGYGGAFGAGTAQQGLDQQQINDRLSQWAAGDQRAQSLLNDYWSIVGKPLGSTTTQTQDTQETGQGGLLGALRGIASGAGQLGNAFGSGGSANGAFGSLFGSNNVGGVTGLSSNGLFGGGGYTYSPFPTA